MTATNRTTTMSREEYTPPDLTATNQASSSSSSNNKEPVTTTSNAPASTLSPGIDFSRDDRPGKPPLSTSKPYDATQLQYWHSNTTREEDHKKVKWQCVECEEIHRFGPSDYLRCRECQGGVGCAFWKVKDYGRMNLEWRTFIAR